MKTTLLLATTAALLLGGLSPAVAQTRTTTDRSGDVTAYTLPSLDNDTDIPAPVRHGRALKVKTDVRPNRRIGDITSFRVSHRAHAVRLFLQFRELNRNKWVDEYEFTVKTPKATYTVTFQAADGKDNYPASGSPADLMETAPLPSDSFCQVQRTIDYRANTVLVVIPRHCLGKPAWVRAGARVDTDEHGASGFEDRAHKGAGFGPDSLGARVRRS